MKIKYTKPHIEVIEFQVERGFARTEPPEGNIPVTEPSDFKDFDTEDINNW